MSIPSDINPLNTSEKKPIEKTKPLLTVSSEVVTSLTSQTETLFGFGSWQWIVETEQMVWSDGLMHLFGYGPETFGSNYKDLSFFTEHLHPLDKERAISYLVEVKQLSAWIPLEVRILTFDGKQKWISIKGQISHIYSTPTWICLIEDITSQVTSRQQEEKAVKRLRQQEKLFQCVEHNFHYGSLEWDLDTNEVVWSEGMMSLMGYTPETFGNNPCTPDLYLSHLPAEDVQKTTTMIEHYKTTQNFSPFEQRVITKDGKEKVLAGEWSISSEERKVICLLHDITQEKQKDIQIEQQAWALENIFRNTPTSMCVLKVVYDEEKQISDLVYVYVSQTLQEQTRLAESELIGKSMLQLFPEVKNSHFWLAYQRVLITKESERFEDFYEFDGYQNWLEGQVAYLDDHHLLSSFTIINDLKQIQQALEHQSALFESVINNSPVCIVLYRAIRDASGQIIDFVHELSNPANSLITGKTEEELIGKSWLTHYPENRVNGFFDLFVSVVETGRTERKTFLYDAHSIKGWFDGNIVKQGDGILFTYQDITALTQQQQQIEQTNLELTRSNTELENFAYVASHDLQEPLRKVKSFSSLLVKEYSTLLEGNGQLYIQRMQMAVERMQTLINDLLEYSRVGRLEEGYQQVNLNELITKVWMPLKEEKENTGKLIEFTIDELPEVHAIPSQINQLFANLLGNAVKFSKPDEPLTIQIRRMPLTEEDRGNLRFVEQTEYIKIVVEDNGIGFEPEHKERIFGLFQRLHGRSEYEGSGIGLAICKRIVENHKGFMYADSEPGKGAQFIVLLPA
ncbi:ATP-binding protein [Xanthocytophaga flava]|uniref:ATP-binding protein n=1 Tax=Xanthocytophaga flava TaxID=3048013 RepID=UPI0028D7A20F|nr:ATP-binding protein [Xanthocytophaga flavus]MDJ1467742.1 ATP-binding protein [Xanthocytophaga flavus]